MNKYLKRLTYDKISTVFNYACAPTKFQALNKASINEKNQSQYTKYKTYIHLLYGRKDNHVNY